MRNDRPSNPGNGEGWPKNNSSMNRGNNANPGGYGNQNNAHAGNVYAPDNSHARAQEHHNAPHPDKNENRGDKREQKEHR